MERDKIRESIREIATETLGVELSEEEFLKESGVDSLSLVSIIVEIEEKFGFSFGENDLQPEKLQTLADLIEITEKYL